MCRRLNRRLSTAALRVRTHSTHERLLFRLNGYLLILRFPAHGLSHGLYTALTHVLVDDLVSILLCRYRGRSVANRAGIQLGVFILYSILVRDHTCGLRISCNTLLPCPDRTID